MRVALPSLTPRTGYTNKIVGEALKPYRDRVVVATKFGIKMQDGKQVRAS
jgi:aryl-alcohol dehydrogenase-like predicted oxidoreductase